MLSGNVAAAADRYVLIVAGVSGSPSLAETHGRWVQTLADALTGALELPVDHLILLRDRPADAPDAATREGVQRALLRLKQHVTQDGLLCVVLIGHGTFDGVDAKFNLVGPDLESAEWRRLLDGIAGTVVLVNTTGASFPFLRRLASPRRAVITATDSPAQKYDTVFPEFFVAAFADPECDLDKDGRTSIGEAFVYASARTRRWYEQRGQLPTERALVDDDGDGVGKEAGAPGSDGAVASRLFLDQGPDERLSSDPAVSELVARRDLLEAKIEELKRKRTFMPPADYDSELERLLIDLARVSRQIRSRS
jgi:hypothetical protein